MDNECKKLLAHQWKGQTQRQFIIVFKIIIPISVVHFSCELNQKRSQYPNWYCDYKLPEFNLTLNLFFAFHTLVKFSPTKPTAFSRLCKNLSCVQTSAVSQHNCFDPLSDLSPCHFNLYSTNTLLS